MNASLIHVCSNISEKVATQLSISSELRLSSTPSLIVFNSVLYSVYMKKVYKTLTFLSDNLRDDAKLISVELIMCILKEIPN